MTEQDIKSILRKGEGLTIEFKASFNSDVIETLVAIANTKGGSVFIGISDDLKLKDVTVNPESIQN